MNLNHMMDRLFFDELCCQQDYCLPELREEIRRTSKRLSDTLEQGQRELLRELLADFEDVQKQTAYGNFMCGYRLATQLLLGALGPPNGLLHEDPLQPGL